MLCHLTTISPFTASLVTYVSIVLPLCLLPFALKGSHAALQFCCSGASIPMLAAHMRLCVLICHACAQSRQRTMLLCCVLQCLFSPGSTPLHMWPTPSIRQASGTHHISSACRLPTCNCRNLSDAYHCSLTLTEQSQPCHVC